MDKPVLCFLCLLVIIVLLIYLNKHKQTEHKQIENFKNELKEKLKETDNLDLLNNIKYYNQQTYNELKKNVLLFYQTVEYIKSDIRLFSQYFNNLLMVENCIYFLIDSVHLNVVQHKDVKNSINEMNDKIMETLDLEIYKLLIKYKKHLNTEDDLNIFTQTLTDVKIRPYNML